MDRCTHTENLTANRLAEQGRGGHGPDRGGEGTGRAGSRARGGSRGAFTVRSLAGLVRNCGILRRDAAHRVDDAFELYRSRSHRSSPRAEESVLFRRSNALEDISPIHYIGVWDTVGSLGNPLLLNGFLSRRNWHVGKTNKKQRLCLAM